jgi:serine/threonine protein phosphatase PrpC
MAAEVNLFKNNFVFGVVARAVNGEGVNGDAYLIKLWGSHVLIALIDGLGHGVDAALASTEAKKFVEEHFETDIGDIMLGLHEYLRKTRGAVVGLARIDQAEKKFSYCGVGNIEIQVLSEPPMHPTSLEGVVGMNMIRIKKFEYHYNSLKFAVLYSDGISSTFDLPSDQRFIEPQKTAEFILNECGSRLDDATVIIAMKKATKG